MPLDCEPETQLIGGIANRGLVVRVGDTVRRPQRPTGSATAAVLNYLEDAGFDRAPRHLGVDHKDREVLSYIPGEAVTQPYPPWAMTDAALASVAQLLRSYHDVVAGFNPRAYNWPGPVPAPFRSGLVSHNDPNLDNVVFRNGHAVALIDFDLAAPGSRIWDVAAAARLWAPLRPEGDIRDVRRGRSLHRFRLFVDAYGRDAIDDMERLVIAVVRNHDWLYDVVRDGVSEGNPGFTDYWTGGADARERRTRRWYDGNYDTMLAALL